MKLNQLKGYILVFISSILFGSYGIWAVLIGKDFGVFFQGYIRAIIILIILIPICIYLKSWKKIENKDYKYFIWFSLFVVFTQAPLYYAFQNSGVGIASLIFFATYLISQYIFGSFVLKERISLVKAVALILAIIGLFFIFDTSIGIFSVLALFMASLNGIASGFEVASTKFLTKYSPIQTSIIAWSSIAITHLPISILLKEKQIIPTFSFEYLSMFCFALAGALAFLLVVYGYKYVEASVGGLLGLFEIIFAIIFGAVVFGEKITLSIIIGSLIILISASLLYIIKDK